MAKKKSNTNLIMSVIALTGALVAGIGLFLNVWKGYIETNLGTEESFVKIFNENLSELDAAFCGRMFEILAIIAIVAIIASVILTLVTKKASIITTVLNIVAIAAIVVAVICGIIFMIANKSTELGITVGIKGAIGFYMIAIGGVVGSVAAFLGARK